MCRSYLFKVRAFMCLLLCQQQYRGRAHPSHWQLFLFAHFSKHSSRLLPSPSLSPVLFRGTPTEGTQMRRLAPRPPDPLAGRWEPSVLLGRPTPPRRKRPKLPGQPPTHRTRAISGLSWSPSRVCVRCSGLGNPSPLRHQPRPSLCCLEFRSFTWRLLLGGFGRGCGQPVYKEKRAGHRTQESN